MMLLYATPFLPFIYTATPRSQLEAPWGRIMLPITWSSAAQYACCPPRIIPAPTLDPLLPQTAARWLAPGSIKLPITCNLFTSLHCEPGDNPVVSQSVPIPEYPQGFDPI